MILNPIELLFAAGRRECRFTTTYFPGAMPPCVEAGTGAEVIEPVLRRRRVWTRTEGCSVAKARCRTTCVRWKSWVFALPDSVHYEDARPARFVGGLLHLGLFASPIFNRREAL